jgi:extracellular elastinolytic metalloproteinase
LALVFAATAAIVRGHESSQELIRGYSPPTFFASASGHTPGAREAAALLDPTRGQLPAPKSPHSGDQGWLSGGGVVLPTALSAMNWFKQGAADFGYTATDVELLVPVHSYSERDTGILHVSLQQQLHGTLLDSTGIEMSVMPDGRVMSVGGSLMSGLASNSTALRTTNTPTLQLTPYQAIERAASRMGLPTLTSPAIRSPEAVQGVLGTYTIPEWSSSEIKPQLRYVPTGPNEVRLAYSVGFMPQDEQHSWQISVDAETGDVLRVGDAVAFYSSADYTIYAKPSPLSGPQVVVSDPWDAEASPRGWLYWPELPDTPGRPGVYQRTWGNNASAGEVVPAIWGDNLTHSVAPSSIVGDRLVYDFPYNTQAPGGDPANIRAGTVNAFFWVNRLHDIYFKFGFDEAAGNFQRVNLSGQGLGDDEPAVYALANAHATASYFSAEGVEPKLAYSPWSDPAKSMAVDMRVIAHEHQHLVTQRLLGSPYDLNSYVYLYPIGMFHEGWSDFFPLLLAQKAANDVDSATDIFEWSAPNLRNHPYSYDMSVTPNTLSMLDTFELSRDFGKTYDNAELWAAPLWDLNKVLIEKYGYAEDLLVGYDGAPGAPNAGNVLAFKMNLVAMDILPEEGFGILQARDALFTADQMLTGGENLVEMWRVFARRGWGYSAEIVGNGAVEAFDLPPNLPGYQAGDFDVDGDVDGNDYLEWQRNFGSRTSFWADANLNGIVDAADYVIWRKHFGEGGSAVASNTAVPEPTTTFLLAIAGACFFLRRERRRPA